MFLQSLSLSLGLIVLLIPFQGKDSFSPKKNKQQQVNNSQKEKQSHLRLPRKKSTILYIILIIIGIIILIMIITIIIKIIEQFTYFLKKKQIESYLCTAQIKDGEIYIVFAPQQQLNTDQFAEQLYQLDIMDIQPPEKPQWIQDMYQNLKQENNRNQLVNLGKRIDNFFRFIDTRLLLNAHHYLFNSTKKHIFLSNELHQIVNQLKIKIENKFFFKKSNPIAIRLEFYQENDYLEHLYTKKVPEEQKEEDKDSFKFFQKTVENEKMTYYDCYGKVFLFQHYYYFLQVIRNLSRDLDNFFKNKNNAEDANKYQGIYKTSRDNVNEVL